MDSEALSSSELQVRWNFIAIIRCTNTLGKRQTPSFLTSLYMLPLIKHRGRELITSRFVRRVTDISLANVDINAGTILEFFFYNLGLILAKNEKQFVMF